MGNNIKKSYRLPLFPIAIFFFFVFVFNANAIDFTENFDYANDIKNVLNTAFLSFNFPTNLSLVNEWTANCYGDCDSGKIGIDKNVLNCTITQNTASNGFIDCIIKFNNPYSIGAGSFINFDIFTNIHDTQGYNFFMLLENKSCIMSMNPQEQNAVNPITSTDHRCTSTTMLNLDVETADKSTINGWNRGKTLNMTYYLDGSSYEIKYIGFGLGIASSKTDFIMLDNLSITNVYETENSLPELSINNLKSIYCYNDTSENSNIYNFELNATDEENDQISYFTYWNNDLDNTVIVDDFNNPSYVMEENGWAFDSQNCSYKTDSAFLELNKSCNNVQMIKWLYAGNLNENIDIDFDAWTYYNSSNVYEIWNWHNEKVVGLKLASYIDNYDLGPYTNFSYWNGTEYVYFGTSYYFGLFSIKYDMNTTTVHYCINGLDEPSYYDCNEEVYEELHGTTDNIPGKFYMKPTFNNYFNNLPYVVLDNLRYKENPDSINWQTYNEGDEVVHIVDGEGIQFLTVYVTDNVNMPEYREYQFPITFQGLCSILVSQNLSQFNSSLDSIIDKSNQYLDGIDNGKSKFNWGFWILLFVLFVYLLIQLANFEYALMLTGLCGFVGAYLISGDYVQMISSVSLIGFGITIIISRSFI